MNETPIPLSVEINRLSNELKRLDGRMQTEPCPDLVMLNEFRQSVDNIRLTAWTVTELSNARQVKKQADKVLAFLSAERLRRLDQLVLSLCEDIDRRLITFKNYGLRSLLDSVNGLQQRPVRCISEEGRGTDDLAAS